MFKIKVRVDGKWLYVAKTYDYQEALEVYNDSPTPRMFIGSHGIEHKQYTDNGFIYNGKNHATV
jgi:hypothetical protein